MTFRGLPRCREEDSDQEGWAGRRDCSGGERGGTCVPGFDQAAVGAQGWRAGKEARPGGRLAAGPRGQSGGLWAEAGRGVPGGDGAAGAGEPPPDGAEG